MLMLKIENRGVSASKVDHIPMLFAQCCTFEGIPSINQPNYPSSPRTKYHLALDPIEYYSSYMIWPNAMKSVRPVGRAW